MVKIFIKCKQCGEQKETYKCQKRQFCSKKCKDNFCRNKPLSRRHKLKISATLKRIGHKPAITRGESHHSWKGEKVGYRGIHNWIERELGNPKKCDNCGKDNLIGHYIHWSNISGKYKRIKSDWRRLCAKCHKQFDIKNVK